MLSSRQFLMITSLAIVVGVGFAPLVGAQNIEAYPKTIQVTERGALVDAQFSITVTNRESEVISNVVVKLADGSEAYVGDVPPGESAVSAPHTVTFDISTWLTRALPMPAVLTFTLAGAGAQVNTSLLVLRPAPAGSGQ